MWKVILQKRGLKVEELMLWKMLLWGKQHGYKADTVTAFSVPVWQGLGDKLFDSASRGSKEAASLLTTWYLLLETVKDIREQRDRMKEPVVPIVGGGQSSPTEDMGSVAESSGERAGQPKPRGRQKNPFVDDSDDEQPSGHPRTIKDRTYKRPRDLLPGRDVCPAETAEAPVNPSAPPCRLIQRIKKGLIAPPPPPGAGRGTGDLMPVPPSASRNIRGLG